MDYRARVRVRAHGRAPDGGRADVSASVTGDDGVAEGRAARGGQGVLVRAKPRFGHLAKRCRSPCAGAVLPEHHPDVVNHERAPRRRGRVEDGVLRVNE